MLPLIPPYRPFGQQAFAYVDLLTPPGAGDKITVNGVDYTYGTHFSGVGRSLFAICQNLAEAIRGEPNNDGHTIRNPLSPVTAIAYGGVSGLPTARLFLVATEPGAGGNALTLTTNNSAVFAVSGATFSGGSAAASGTTGQQGVINETGTTAITGITAYAIQMLNDSVFSALTDTIATGDPITGLTLPAGMVIYGNFTAFTLTSGAVKAYKK